MKLRYIVSMKNYWLLAIGCWLLALVTGCAGADQAVKKGDKFYALGEYFDAANQYKKAYSQTPPKQRALRGKRALKMAECYRRINYTQKAIAAYNNAVRYKQEDLRQHGHAIECRICAEDTEHNFMPSPGVIQQLTEPHGIGTRIDSYVYEGYEIPVHYDPMIGKLIVWATTREYAIERMRRVLYEYKITGLTTNIRYLRRIIDVPEFKEGNYNTHFIERNEDRLRPRSGFKNDSEPMAVIAAYIDYLMNLEENSSVSPTNDGSAISRWRAFGLQKGVLRV